MIKRVNKILGITMLIAFIMPMTPAMAAKVTIQDLDSQEGSIDNAVVFKDGRYVYQGSKGNNSSGVYYNDGTSEKELDDVDQLDYQDNLSQNSKYGDKYALASEHGNQYMVDLSNGEVIKDGDPDDLLTSAETKLKRKLSKTNRYGSDVEIKTFKQIAPGMLDDNSIWYEYTAKTTTGAGAEVTYFGYVDDGGNYIDCSKTANVYIWTGEKNVNVDEFNDTVTKYGKTVTVGLPTVKRTLGQDADYIYNVIEVPVTGYHRLNPTDYTPDYGDNDTATLYFVQKISKARGDKEDGAFLPKEVQSYQLNVDIGYSDIGGSNDKWKYFVASAFLGNFDPSLMQVKISGGMINLVTTCPDSLIQNKNNEPEIAITQIFLLPSIRIDRDSDKEEKMLKNVAGSVAIYFSKSDLDENSTLYSETLHKPTSSWAMDKDGTVWNVYKGKIKKYFAWDEFYTVYTCDPEINHIDVYDGNIVAWSDKDNIFVTAKKDVELAKATGVATTGAGATVTDSKTTTSSSVTVTNQTGWQSLQDGWHFYNEKGISAKGWIKDGSSWYYLDDKGIMKTGWISENQKWYYLDVSGAMKTGWIKAQDGKWYYLNSSGAMENNTTIDGYLLGSDGAWIQ